MLNLRSESRPILWFVLGFALYAGAYFALYYLLFDFYAAVVFRGAEVLLKISNSNLRDILFRPEASFVGFLFRGDSEIYAIRYNPYFVFMNLSITLALIASTPGSPPLRKLTKSAQAFVLILLLHWFEAFVDLAYASSTIQPAAQWIPYSEPFKRFLFETNRLYNHMGQYLAPFLIWFLLCHRDLLRALSGLEPPPRNTQAVGRNDPCPCGSGKKYKACCGK